MLRISREDLEAFFKVAHIMIRKDVETLAPKSYKDVDDIVDTNIRVVLNIVQNKFDDKKTSSPEVKDQKTLNDLNAITDKLNADFVAKHGANATI